MVVMASVSDGTETPSAPPVKAALCIEPEAFDRFGRVLRHLLVGLVDQAIDVRLISTDPRVERLTLGPIQTVVYQRITWPVASRRAGALFDAIAHRPPTLVHALSGASYGVAGAVAGAFDADLILQVTSLQDCRAAAEFSSARIGRYAAFSRPLMTALEEHSSIPAELIDLIHPGVKASEEPVCFSHPERIPTLLCSSPLERGSGVERLIEAADMLRRRNHDFMLFLLGAGRQESALRHMIRQRNLLSHVALAHLVQGLAQAMNNADIYVRPSEDTAFSDDALHAMGTGLAVVTGASPICDHYRPDETAVVCDRLDAESFANAIERLLTDRAGAQRMAASGMAYVRNHHAVSIMAERSAEAYRRLALARATFPLKE
jgi:glycosyltransferase involved in cell wall biosynthesis